MTEDQKGDIILVTYNLFIHLRGLETHMLKELYYTESCHMHPVQCTANKTNTQTDTALNEKHNPTNHKEQNLAPAIIILLPMICCLD